MNSKSCCGKIFTAKDPIEMICENFDQIAVVPVVDKTFASIPSNILTQDPDIVMIGKIGTSKASGIWMIPPRKETV